MTTVGIRLEQSPARPYSLVHEPAEIRRQLPRQKAFLALTLILGLVACSSTDTNASLPRKYDNVAAKDWIERRANQLAASGIKPGEATLKATQEWNHRSLDGSETEGLTIYDSAAKQKAEQQKVNEGLDKLQKGK